MVIMIMTNIMHMKLIIADHRSLYLGSANMDWLSFSQVKEMGILILNNDIVAQDLLNYYNIISKIVIIIYKKKMLYKIQTPNMRIIQNL